MPQSSFRTGAAVSGPATRWPFLPNPSRPERGHASVASRQGGVDVHCHLPTATQTRCFERADRCRAEGPLWQCREGAQPGLVEPVEERDGHVTVRAGGAAIIRMSRQVVQLGPIDTRIPDGSRIATRGEGLTASMKLFPKAGFATCSCSHASVHPVSPPHPDAIALASDRCRVRLSRMVKLGT